MRKPTGLARLSGTDAGPKHLLSGVRYEFIEEGRAANFSPRTLKWYEETLGGVCRWLQDHEAIGHLEDVTKASLIHLIADMRDRGLSADYVDGHYRAIRAWLRWARHDYQLSPSLFDADGKLTVRRPEVPKKERPRYTDEQVTAIFDAIAHKQAKRGTRERDRVLIETFLGSGCRLSELVTLTVENVQQDQDGNSFLHVLGKGRKWRWVPIPTRLRRDLERYVHRQRPQSLEPYVFLTVDGGQLALRSVQDIIMRVEREVGFRLHAHAFRHHYGTTYASRPGANIAKLQRIMGHTNIATTMGYVHLSKADLAEGIDELDPL